MNTPAPRRLELCCPRSWDNPEAKDSSIMASWHLKVNEKSSNFLWVNGDDRTSRREAGRRGMSWYAWGERRYVQLCSSPSRWFLSAPYHIPAPSCTPTVNCAGREPYQCPPVEIQLEQALVFVLLFNPNPSEKYFEAGQAHLDLGTWTIV